MSFRRNFLEEYEKWWGTQWHLLLTSWGPQKHDNVQSLVTVRNFWMWIWIAFLYSGTLSVKGMPHSPHWCFRKSLQLFFFLGGGGSPILKLDSLKKHMLKGCEKSRQHCSQLPLSLLPSLINLPVLTEFPSLHLPCSIKRKHIFYSNSSPHTNPVSKHRITQWRKSNHMHKK